MVPYIDVPNLVYINSVIKKTHTHTQGHVRKKIHIPRLGTQSF